MVSDKFMKSRVETKARILEANRIHRVPRDGNRYALAVDNLFDVECDDARCAPARKGAIGPIKIDKIYRFARMIHVTDAVLHASRDEGEVRVTVPRLLVSLILGQ